ncbi:MAG: hypothetical protein LLG04_01005 [Parachlamydia sp.]|nr:hypothetical protein [Parachlamydia sp.]
MDAPLSLSLPEVFFPRALLQELAEQDQLSDKEKIAYMTLLMSNLEESLRAFKEKRLTAFDALVGDEGCQLRALKILDLATSERFASEANQLQEVARRVNEEMKEMYNRLPQQKKCLLHKISPDGAVKNFFNQKVRSIGISKEMAYLLQCHLLTFTKMPIDAVREKIEIGRLERLAKGGKIALQNEVKSSIINLVQGQLSELSIDFLRNEVRQIVSLPGNQSGLLSSMLDLIQRIPSRRGVHPIARACQFYSMKAVLCRLRERGALIVVKKWLVTKDAQPIASLFYRAGADGAFVRVSDEEVRKFSAETPVVVFEGIVPPHLGSEQLAGCLQKHELGEVTLAEVAQGDQFEPGRKGLEDISPEARKEIESYCERAVEMNCIKECKETFLWLDHIYCSSLGEACKGGAR